MSLIRQLWIAVVMMMLIAFISSFSISTFKAKNYFEEQLLLKNIDNAGSLALTLSQIEKDPVTLELLIAAQFDTGHYQRIELLNPQGEVLQRKLYEGDDETGVPDWFKAFASLNIEPGVAQVQDGWFQYGTLYVESHKRFAYQALWATTRDLLVWFLLVALAAGLLGTVILKWITRPLNDVVNQAEAIGGRRFITSDVPRTLEFSRVVKAMNRLSERIRDMLDSERQRLEALRYKHQHDPLTGVANREYFISQLGSVLSQQDVEAQHQLLLVRVKNLARVNAQLGHQATDQLLQTIAEQLKQQAQAAQPYCESVEIGRLNGSDFVMLFTEVSSLDTVQHTLLVSLQKLAMDTAGWIQFPGATTTFTAGEEKADVLMRLDSLLANAEQQEATCLESNENSAEIPLFNSADAWRFALHEALLEQTVYPEYFPVLTLSGELIHQEAMMRLTLAHKVCSAGFFVPWARRLELIQQLDVALIRSILQQFQSGELLTPVAINLSKESLLNMATVKQIRGLLSQQQQFANKVAFEVAERVAVQHAEGFKAFCMEMQSIGCQLGLEHAGAGFAHISNLQELALDYIKVDKAFIADLEANQSGQNFIQGLVTLGHSIGVKVIAEGVQNDQQKILLQDMGFDGVTGPGVR